MHMATIALAASSDPLSAATQRKIRDMRAILAKIDFALDERYAMRYGYFAEENFSAQSSAGEYFPANGERISPQIRADLLMELFTDSRVDAIVDISGGNLSNEVLDFLDYSLIADHVKPFAAYSDNTALNLALYRYAGLHSVYWNASTIVCRGTRDIRDFVSGKRFIPYIFPDSSHVSEQYKNISDVLVSGDLPIIGGNIRCMAKLAGTRYWPTLHEAHAVLLESFSQTLPAAVSTFTHLRHAGLFNHTCAVILGQFTTIDKTGQRERLVQIMQEYIDIPIFHAPYVGHSLSAQPVTIG